MPRAQIIDQDPSNVHLFYRDLRDVGFLIFSLPSGGGACRTDTQETLFG